MPPGTVKKGEEKHWKKAKEVADARVKDGKLKKDTDAYWGFVNSTFQKLKSGKIKPKESTVKEGRKNHAQFR